MTDAFPFVAAAIRGVLPFPFCTDIFVPRMASNAIIPPLPLSAARETAVSPSAPFAEVSAPCVNNIDATCSLPYFEAYISGE